MKFFRQENTLNKRKEKLPFQTSLKTPPLPENKMDQRSQEMSKLQNNLGINLTHHSMTKSSIQSSPAKEKELSHSSTYKTDDLKLMMPTKHASGQVKHWGSAMNITKLSDSQDEENSQKTKISLSARAATGDAS